MTDASLGNFGKSSEDYKDDHINVVIALNLGFIVILAVSATVYRNIQFRIIKRIDENNITPSDYTVMASNLPKDKTKEEIEEYLYSHFDNIKIESINL